jgi:hypothetical protein
VIGREAALALAWVGFAGAIGAWAGPAGADFPTYLAQARALDLADRPTHAAFVAVLVPLSALPAAAFGWLGAAALAAAVWVRTAAPEQRAAALLVLTPVAAWPEVDPWWLAALVGSGGAAPGVAAAVAWSPAALLALPALARDRRAWLAAVAVVAALTAASAGGWWWGERGVLAAPGWRPGQTVSAWVRHAPWLLLPAIRADRALARDLLACLPLLGLPPDVPGWAVPAARLAWAVEPGGRSARLLLLQAALTGWLVAATAGRVEAENAAVAAVAAALRPGDGVEAPFGWGARVAIAATGAPYGLPWHPPGRFLRDQRAAWCGEPPDRVWVLPAGPDGAFRLRSDAAEDCR